ncbi:MAG: NAD-dependent epimerase/dehydratase family protein [Legionellaceae bacterium]
MNFQVTATTRDNNALGYDAALDCEVIHCSEKTIEHALATTTHLLISTPPTPEGHDPMLLNFGDVIQKFSASIQWMGYLSSTSVYGDHQGAWVDETSELKAVGGQGHLRLSAEQAWVSFTQKHRLPLTVFRLAGIYGPERNALARLMAGKNETLVKEGHCFSRIYVDDIASVIIASMQQPKPGLHVYNVADDEPAPSDVVERYAALLLHLPPLKEVPYEAAILSPMAKEFYSHHKRVSNAKLKRELKLDLAYPTYKEGLAHLLQQDIV